MPHFHQQHEYFRGIAPALPERWLLWRRLKFLSGGERKLPLPLDRRRTAPISQRKPLFESLETTRTNS